MEQADVNAWLNDLAEAVAIGREIGNRVIVIGTSTGGTLATFGATLLRATLFWATLFRPVALPLVRIAAWPALPLPLIALHRPPLPLALIATGLRPILTTPGLLTRPGVAPARPALAAVGAAAQLILRTFRIRRRAYGQAERSDTGQTPEGRFHAVPRKIRGATDHQTDKPERGSVKIPSGTWRGYRHTEPLHD